MHHEAELLTPGSFTCDGYFIANMFKLRYPWFNCALLEWSFLCICSYFGLAKEIQDSKCELEVWKSVVLGNILSIHKGNTKDNGFLPWTLRSEVGERTFDAVWCCCLSLRFGVSHYCCWSAVHLGFQFHHLLHLLRL